MRNLKISRGGEIDSAYSSLSDDMTADTPPSNQALTKLMMLVVDKQQSCPAIQGILHSKVANRLVIDVAQGQAQAVRSFLQQHFENEYKHNKFFVTEQSATGTFLGDVASDAHITSTAKVTVPVDKTNTQNTQAQEDRPRGPSAAASVEARSSDDTSPCKHLDGAARSRTFLNTISRKRERTSTQADIATPKSACYSYLTGDPAPNFKPAWMSSNLGCIAKQNP